MTGLPTVTVKLDDGSGAWATDISTYVRMPDSITVDGVGRTDEFTEPDSAQMTLALDNTDGRFTNGTVTIAPDSTLIRYTATSGSTTKDRFTGRIISLQQQWPDGGQEFATVTVTAQDVLTDLSRKTLRSLLEQEILLDNPTAYYTLGEAAGATSAGDTSGVGNSSLSLAGRGSPVVFGDVTQAITGLTDAAFAGHQFLRSGTNQTYIASGSSAWSVEFYFTALTSGNYVLSDGPGGTIGLANVLGFASLSLALGGIGGGGASVGVPLNWDGLLHQAVFTYDGTTLSLYVDGSLADTGTGTGTTADSTQVAVGASLNGSLSLAGTMSNVAIYDTVLSAGRVGSHAAALTGFIETTDARLSRLASYAGLTAATSDPSGQIMGSQDTTGEALFDAMQDVVNAEGGVLFADGSGNIVMQGRYYRAIETSPDLTLDADAVDPATSVTWDTQQKFNQVTVTRSGGAQQIASSPGALAGTDVIYPMSLDLDVDTDANALGSAQWIVAKHTTTTPRLGSVVFDLLTSSHAASLLALQIGDRLSLTPMPSQMWAGVTDFTIEGWTETVNDGEWTLTFNLLPWSLFQAWVLGDATYGLLGTTTVLGY